MIHLEVSKTAVHFGFLAFLNFLLLYFVSLGPQLHTMYPGSPETFVVYLWFKQGFYRVLKVWNCFQILKSFFPVCQQQQKIKK